MKRKMVKKIIKRDLGFVLLIVLVPIRSRIKDGGTVAYNAAIYSVYDVHSIYDVGDSETIYSEGYIVKIFGKEIFNNTNPHVEF